MARFEGDVIELRAVNPSGDLACDTSIATPEARSGLGDALRLHVRPPVREITDGIEVSFASEGWDTVQRYIELESRCCSFLSLKATRASDGVVLTITGRSEALPWIKQIFA